MVVAGDAVSNVSLPSDSHPLLCLFGNQPKDTQQALSRKESAVNMEKFKKFAARRKWKVSLGLERGGASFCSLHSELELWVGRLASC